MNANAIYALLLNKIKKLDMDIQAIPNPLIYRGSVISEADLPFYPQIGDMYNLETKSNFGEAGMNVGWTGEKWDSLGPAIDMSVYYTRSETDARYEPITVKAEMTSSDESVVLHDHIFYIFPEMAALSLSLNGNGEYHFKFTSGETATLLTLPNSIKSDLVVEPNRIYEVSIAENLLAWISWAVI